MHFFCIISVFSLPAAGLSSRSRLRGTQVGHVYTTTQDWSPAGLRDASWLFFRRLHSATPSRARPWTFPQFHIFCSAAAFMPSLQLKLSTLWQPRRSSSSSSNSTRQALPFVAATDGASVCVRVCNDSWRPTEGIRANTIIISIAGQLNDMRARDRTI